MNRVEDIKSQFPPLKDSNIIESGKGGGSVCLKDSDNRYTVKISKASWYNTILKKEYELLTELNKMGLNFIPNVYYYNKDIMIMDYCGERVTKETYNEEELVNIMKKLIEINLTHNDVYKDNLLSKNGKLYLIDFGHAHWVGKGRRNPNPYPDDTAIERIRKSVK